MSDMNPFTLWLSTYSLPVAERPWWTGATVPDKDTHWDVGGNLILFGRTSTIEDNDDWEEWPPKNAVLVAGPSPWGRDRPWAPKGWQP